MDCFAHFNISGSSVTPCIDRAAATSLAMRHLDGSLPVEDFNIELENQSGEKVQMGSETDQSNDGSDASCKRKTANLKDKI
ncbi:hypothetical protein RJ640_007367 [Escallonia rubra]|uniref:Uncharacterized protein n=1 Tax=Escallonia rubra TaxID=112253 RepID=A0AA88SL45_9ASTE|nr:hypothetical protein RJ640_007367 [Escallonia rubra]